MINFKEREVFCIFVKSEELMLISVSSHYVAVINTYNHGTFYQSKFYFCILIFTISYLFYKVIDR